MKRIETRVFELLWPGATKAHEAQARGVYEDVQALRISFQRLHRRCQRAEAAAAGKLRHAQPRMFGRGLMAWALAEEQKRNKELQAKVDMLISERRQLDAKNAAA